MQRYHTSKALSPQNNFPKRLKAYLISDCQRYQLPLSNARFLWNVQWSMTADEKSGLFSGMVWG